MYSFNVSNFHGKILKTSYSGLHLDHGEDVEATTQSSSQPEMVALAEETSMNSESQQGNFC